MNDYLCGTPLISSKILVIDTDIPVKKCRIKFIQKWLIKRYGYVKKPDPNVYITPNGIIGHPETIAILKDNMKL